jgi:hypothetical protein
MRCAPIVLVKLKTSFCCDKITLKKKEKRKTPWQENPPKRIRMYIRLPGKIWG